MNESVVVVKPLKFEALVTFDQVAPLLKLCCHCTVVVPGTALLRAVKVAV